MGGHTETVIYEHDEDRVYRDLRDNFLSVVPDKKWYQRLTKGEVYEAFEAAWKKTVEDFKKVTIRIL
jgi:hypothetical protein